MSLTLDRLPSGPSALPLVGKQFAFMRNPLVFLSRAHDEYGDLVTLPLNGRRVVAAFGAGQVSAVTDAYGKEIEISPLGGIDTERLKGDLQGRGPLNTTGEEHAAYRLICLRALGGESTKTYAEITTELTERLLDSLTVGDEVDLLPIMAGFTHRLFKYYMFGSDIRVTDPELDAAVDLYSSVMDSLPRRLFSTLLPHDIPGLSRGGTLRTKLALIDSRVAAIGDGSVRPPRLSLAETMLRELDNAGVGRDPVLARELMLQLYFAGLTSLSSTVVWTFLLLALHPEPARKLLDELHEALAGRVPERQDTRQLPGLDAVLEESMRLYPGGAFDFKTTEEELDLDGYRLPPGFPILLSPWVTQRSPGSFDDPESFRPERFADRQHTYHKGAFSPWGVGARACTGKVLARTMIRSVLGGVVQRYRLDLVPHQRIDPHSAVFGHRLVPRPGVRFRIARQDGDTERSVAPIAGFAVGATPGPAGQR